MRPVRTLLFLSFALAAAGALWRPATVHAQMGGGPGAGGPDQQQQEEDAKRKKREQEFGTNQAALPQLRNAGPCPYVKSLYDAARYVEFKDNREASASVAYTGEIQNISSACAYQHAEPIRVTTQVLFEFGRGPQATSSRKVYTYWVAVTDRNRAVLAKQDFALPVIFPAGQDRVSVRETLKGITIPRADSNVSGANFEVLMGFDVTPQMAAFNRDGKRFRPNAGTTAQVSAATR
jgi:hypothetical protein